DEAAGSGDQSPGAGGTRCRAHCQASRAWARSVTGHTSDGSGKCRPKAGPARWAIRPCCLTEPTPSTALFRFARRRIAASFRPSVPYCMAGPTNQVDSTYRSELKDLNELNFARFDAKVEQRFAEAELRLEQRFTEAEVKLEHRFAEAEVKLERRFAEAKV